MLSNNIEIFKTIKSAEFFLILDDLVEKKLEVLKINVNPVGLVKSHEKNLKF